jgi:hypothetical protein
MFTMDERTDPLSGDELRRRLARDLLALKPGDRLPTVRAMAGRHGASLGAVHQAVVRLEDVGAIQVERRHGRGAVLLGRSPGRLWAEAEREPLVISLPLPTAPRVQGLASAIKALLVAQDVAAYLIFLRGARQRLAALRHRQCHLAVMSSLSAGAMLTPDEELIVELPPQSYVLEHRVYYVDRPGGGGRIGRAVIDEDSADFDILTRLEFAGSETRLVPATYMQFERLIDEDRADAAILDAEEDIVARLPATIRDRPLSKAVRAAIGDRNTRAAFVGRAGEPAVRHVLEACLDPGDLLRIQADVVRRDRVPEY